MHGFPNLFGRNCTKQTTLNIYLTYVNQRLSFSVLVAPTPQTPAPQNIRFPFIAGSYDAGSQKSAALRIIR